MSEIVGCVDEQVSVVFFADSLVSFEIGGVRIHRKETFSDDQNCSIWVFFTCLHQFFLHSFLIEVLELDDVFGGGIGSFLKAVV